MAAAEPPVARVDVDDTEWDDGLFLLHDGEPFTGEVEETDADGRLLALETYRNGLADGDALRWHQNGRLRSEVVSNMGHAVGRAREWHENGQLAAEKTFDEGGRLVEVSMWDEDGAPVAGQGRIMRVDTDDTEWDQSLRLTYEGEPYSGEVSEVYPGGGMAALATYSNGLKNGTSLTWHRNGQVQSEVVMQVGRPVGRAREWHENGVVAVEKFYDHGGRVTECREWDEDGEPVARSDGGAGSAERR